MTEENAGTEMPSELPEAVVRTRKPFSIVWVVPLVALLIGGWLAYKAISEKGPTITIIAESITDANTSEPLKANVYINGALIYQGGTQFQVTAPGYNPWGLRPRGKGLNQKLIGPIQLKPEE